MGSPVDRRPTAPHSTQAEIPGLPDFRLDGYGRAVSIHAPRRHWAAFEVDHRYPVACGGSNELGNLQAVHWRVNQRKRDRWAGGWLARCAWARACGVAGSVG